MKVTKKQLEKSQVQLDVVLEPEEFEVYRPQALELLAKELKLEGFRPGRVPAGVAAQHIQESSVLAEAARFAISATYRKAIEQEHLDVIGEPNIQVLKLAVGNPLEFRVQVAVLSEVKLPEYMHIAKESKKREVKVEEKEVEEALIWLQNSRKTENGVTPELTDTFASTIGDFQNMEELKTSITEGLQHEKEGKEKERVRQEILEHIAAKATVEIPDVLVEREKAVLLENVKKGVADMLQVSFEEYLQKAGKTEQELIDSFQAEAEQRVKRFLVLREIANREHITPSAEEMEQESQAVLNHYKNAGRAEKDIDITRLKEYTEGVLRHEKTLQFLENLTTA